MVAIKSKSSYIPQLWLMPAYPLHHFNKNSGIYYGFFVSKCGHIVFD